MIRRDRKVKAPSLNVMPNEGILTNEEKEEEEEEEGKSAFASKVHYSPHEGAKGYLLGRCQLRI